MRIFRERDANMLHLQNSKVAVLGYGNLGRPMSLNLRDSGVPVIVGNQQDDYAEEARREGFEVFSIPDAVTSANVIYMAMPDEAMPGVYLSQIGPALKSGDLLLFASGYNIAFQYIEPPVFVDVGLIAPRALASSLRQAYLSGLGFPSFIALQQRATDWAVDRLLAMALAVGALRQGALETTFQQEVVLDLFWQQALLPALHGLLLTAAQILIKEGYPPEAVLSELYLSGELGEFFSQAAHQGLVQTLESMSLTGQYGLLSRTERFQESKVQHHMEAILDSIRSGDFAREWSSEFTDGYPRLKRLRDKLEGTAVWQQEQIALQAIRGDES
jgi:ketol-acid reductoisomerase